MFGTQVASHRATRAAGECGQGVDGDGSRLVGEIRGDEGLAEPLHRGEVVERDPGGAIVQLDLEGAGDFEEAPEPEVVVVAGEKHGLVGQRTLEDSGTAEVVPTDEPVELADSDAATATRVEVAGQEPDAVLGLEAATHHLQRDLWIGLDPQTVLTHRTRSDSKRPTVAASKQIQYRGGNDGCQAQRAKRGGE